MSQMEVKLPETGEKKPEGGSFSGALASLKEMVGMDPKKGETHQALEQMKEKQSVASLLMLGFVAFWNQLKEAKKGLIPEEESESNSEQGAVATTLDVKSEEAEPVEEETEDLSEKPKNPVELTRPDEAVFIGASHAHGYGMKIEGSEFVGKDGKSSGEVLSILRANKEALKGKKMAVIQGYGNDGLNSSSYNPENTVGNMKAMVDMCREAGIHNISVTLHLPYGAKGSNGKRITPNMLRASRAIQEAFSQPPYASYVNVIDLYTPFADKETGLIKKEYDGGDWLHPYAAYEDALRQVSEKGGNNIDRFMADGANA